MFKNDRTQTASQKSEVFNIMNLKENNTSIKKRTSLGEALHTLSFPLQLSPFYALTSLDSFFVLDSFIFPFRSMSSYFYRSQSRYKRTCSQYITLSSQTRAHSTQNIRNENKCTFVFRMIYTIYVRTH